MISCEGNGMKGKEEIHGQKFDQSWQAGPCPAGLPPVLPGAPRGSTGSTFPTPCTLCSLQTPGTPCLVQPSLPGCSRIPCLPPAHCTISPPAAVQL